MTQGRWEEVRAGRGSQLCTRVCPWGALGISEWKGCGEVESGVLDEAGHRPRLDQYWE